jgi:molybdopterin synthase sulfur carrier subunit
MQIKVLLFGELAQLAGSAELILKDVDSTNNANEMLKSKFPLIASKKYIIVLNKQIVKDSQSLHDGDELALLPPFSGG